ncbi:MAG: RNA-binding protein [Sulfobacillus benefaciens]|uniref:RQC P-site tRNA stabilizing factor n=1 Tax=Sulfobacillus benefaciens TaxID=453960 RepID=A0A2T2X7J7_9FIRM|nr:MAG: RNA-binding protein [Sulfobacillus benefaciens]
MRIDKFLKVSRLIKRRTIAKEVCDAGKVRVNGKVVKAGHEVSVGDRIDIQWGSRALNIEVLEVRENVAAKDAATLYREV